MFASFIEGVVEWFLSWLVICMIGGALYGAAWVYQNGLPGSSVTITVGQHTWSSSYR